MRREKQTQGDACGRRTLGRLVYVPARGVCGAADTLRVMVAAHVELAASSHDNSVWTLCGRLRGLLCGRCVDVKVVPGLLNFGGIENGWAAYHLIIVSQNYMFVAQ